MNEIMKNGPVSVELRLYEDFLNYSGGVYKYRTGKLLGYYYAKIVAWGTDGASQVEFWRAAASFGRNWGNKYIKCIIQKFR
jgi:cathepsin B